MRIEIRHPEYLGIHLHNATYRPPERESGHGWALALLVAVFAAGVVAGVLA